MILIIRLLSKTCKVQGSLCWASHSPLDFDFCFILPLNFPLTSCTRESREGEIIMHAMCKHDHWSNYTVVPEVKLLPMLHVVEQISTSLELNYSLLYSINPIANSTKSYLPTRWPVYNLTKILTCNLFSSSAFFFAASAAGSLDFCTMCTQRWRTDIY